MSEKTEIAWCDSTWNPWRGCQAVSPGCVNCYAKKLVERWGGDFSKRTLAADATFNAPLRWRKKPWVCGECGTAYRDAKDIKELPEAFRFSQPEAVTCCGVSRLHRRRVFSLSLGDWLDPDVPVEWLARMLDTIWRTPELDYLLVTKRAGLWEDRMNDAFESIRNEEPTSEDAEFLHAENPSLYRLSEELQQTGDWILEWLKGNAPKNVWVIATAENQEQADKRIPELLKIPAVVRGLSVEPMLGPIDLKLKGRIDKQQFPDKFDSWSEREKTEWYNSTARATYIARCENPDWVIVGGESGKNARPCNVGWIRDIVWQCKSVGVACFVKQLGSDCIGYESAMLAYRKAEDVKGYKHPKGGDIAEWPEDLRVREWPVV